MRPDLYSHFIFKAFYAFGDLEMVDPVRNLVTNVTHFWNDRCITRAPHWQMLASIRSSHLCFFSLKCYLVVARKTNHKKPFMEGKKKKKLLFLLSIFSWFMSVNNNCKFKSNYYDKFSQIFYHLLLSKWKSLKLYFRYYFRYHAHHILKIFLVNL